MASEAKYRVEVVDYKTAEVIHTVGEDGLSRRSAERVDDGMQINLNHERYFTRLVQLPMEAA